MLIAGVGIGTTITAQAAPITPSLVASQTPATVAVAASPASPEAANKLKEQLAAVLAAAEAQRAAEAAAAEAAAAAERAAAEAAATSAAVQWASGAKPMSVKQCESGNNYSTNTGNGYYGAWQFDRSSWLANGGGQYAAYPHLATPAQQDQIAYNYYQKAGWGPWACG